MAPLQRGCGCHFCCLGGDRLHLLAAVPHERLALLRARAAVLPESGRARGARASAGIRSGSSGSVRRPVNQESEVRDRKSETSDL